MPCDFPLTAFFSREFGKSGKRGITFSRGASFSGQPIRFGCGQCAGCRLEHSRQWAMRAMHEKRMVEASAFLTLTYEDVPVGGTLVKRDLQLFHKRLRKRLGRFRFLACGEYGETNGRPHYHSIVFGVDLPDRRFHKCNERGDRIDTSKVLEDIWGLGICAVGDVSFDSCAYVARYVVGKITGDKAVDHYGGRLPEFALMSRRPGLGTAWYEKYGEEMWQHDSVIMNGVEVPPPRFYSDKLGKSDPARLEVLKKKRKWNVHKHWADNQPERRKVRDKVKRARLALRKRDVT